MSPKAKSRPGDSADGGDGGGGGGGGGRDPREAVLNEANLRNEAESGLAQVDSQMDLLGGAGATNTANDQDAGVEEQWL